MCHSLACGMCHIIWDTKGLNFVYSNWMNWCWVRTPPNLTQMNMIISGAKMCWGLVHLNHHIWRNPQPPTSSLSHSHGISHFCCSFNDVVRFLNISALCRSSQFCIFWNKFSNSAQWPEFQSAVWSGVLKSKRALFTTTKPCLTFVPNSHSRPHFFCIILLLTNSCP